MASSNSALRRISLRTIAAHKVRLALTVLSVVLGTAFIAGAFVFTASLSKAFDGALSTAYDGVDVVVSAEAQNRTALDRATVAAIADKPDVHAVNVSAQQSGVILTGSDGKPIQTNGAPSMGIIYYGPDQAVSQPLKLTEGNGPTKPGEVAINSTAARMGNISVGDTIKVLASKSRADVTVTGIGETPADTTGWIGVYLDRAQWDEFYTDSEHVDTLSIAAADGTSVDQLTAELRRDYPSLKIEPGKVLADEAAEQISTALNFINYFLVAFGLIGLLVGTFIISNTFSMLVAQRTSEFALLRALGASRRQLTRTVLFEATIVGVLGSLLGVAAGFGLTRILYSVLEAFNVSVPGGGLTITWTSVVVPVVTGVVITLLAAWAPAARAGAIPPIEAMRSGDKTTNQPMLVRSIIGLILGAAAAAALIVAAFWESPSTGNRARLVGFGAVAAIATFWLAGPLIARPLVGVLGRIFGAPFGTVGKLAATNSGRNPRRTATTAFALTLGLALVTSVGMLGASMKEAVNEWTETNLAADYILTPPMTAHMALPKEAREDVAKLPEVADSATLFLNKDFVIDPDNPADAAMAAQFEGRQFGPPNGNSTVFTGDFGKWFGVPTVAGSLDLSADNAGLVVKESLAAERGWEVGKNLTMLMPEGNVEIPITGIFEDTKDPTQNIVISMNGLNNFGGPRAWNITALQQYVDVKATEAAGLADARTVLENTVADYLVVQVLSAEEYSNLATQSINVMLGIVYGLLGLAIVISILGVVNTLALSIVERRQEIGMLRAIGLQRKEIRRMIRLESIQISLYGAISGAALGLALGGALLKVLENEGINAIVVPWGQVALMLVLSAIVGVIAALWPAHRAAKTPPLAAISAE